MPGRVLFVCQHGIAKSVIAAEYLVRMARERGLAIEAEAAGLEPEAEIPAHVEAGLRADGLAVRGLRPGEQVSEALLGRADHVVTFGCALRTVVPGAEVFDDWADVPAVSDDYARARSAIVARVGVLLEQLSGGPRAGLRSTLVLTRADVKRWLELGECIDAVEWAFRLHGEGKAIAPGVLGVRVPDGGFHIKTAGVARGREYFAAKVNANYPLNRERNGMPAIQGVIALFDATTGELLALLDSIEVTSQRTAAATAVAARYLAREDASVVTICGCGEQGRSQLRALARVRPLRRVLAFDADSDRAVEYVAEMSDELGLAAQVVRDLPAATRSSDIVVTCTPARRYFIERGMIGPGTFVAAVGADSETKQEIEPELLADSTVVADVLDQCIRSGDLQHAIRLGVMTRDGVHAELAEIVTGRKPGRRRPEEIIVFDSTGSALQDVAAAAIVYERALAAGNALSIALGA